ncbi:hypothetical protein NHJ6243_009716 [Beauveria neobassiana]
MPTTLSQTPKSSSRKPRTNSTHAPESYARTHRQLQNALSSFLLDMENALRSTSAQRSYNTGSVEKTPRTAPLEKTATFAGVTRAANETQPGNRKITPKDALRRKAQALRNNKRVLIRLPDLLDMKETNTGFALTPSTIAIQQKILQNQQPQGPLVRLEVAEKDIKWHTYLIKNFPRTITSWDGTELDYKQTIEEAIKE